VEEALFMGEAEDVLYIKAQGHITANSCPELKNRVFSRLEARLAPANIVVDLEACEYMDSTFMGLLVGFNKRFLRVAEKPITILRSNETCLRLLKTIGVTRLVQLSDDPVHFAGSLQDLSAAARPEARMLLDAHEDLMELSDENQRRFAGLHKVLSKSLGERSDGPAEDT